MSTLNERPTFEQLLKRFQQNKQPHYKYPLIYYKRLNEQIKNHELKDTSLDMRKRILRNQRLSNYQNEYDKIKNILDHVITPPGLTQEYYKNRINLFRNYGLERR